MKRSVQVYIKFQAITLFADIELGHEAIDGTGVTSQSSHRRNRVQGLLQSEQRGLHGCERCVDGIRGLVLQ